MSEKVTLPREVAEAIDHVKHMGLHNIIECVVNMQAFENNTPKISFIRNYFKSDWRLLAEALIYGYEVIETPEERIKRIYDKSVIEHGELACQLDDYTTKILTRELLDILNIKISGVNEE